MKQQKEFYAIAKKGTNRFLCKYQNNERALTFSASFNEDVRVALIFEKADDETEEAIKNIAKAVGGRLVKVKAEYEITEEDRAELEEPTGEESKNVKIEKILSDLLGL